MLSSQETNRQPMSWNQTQKYQVQHDTLATNIPQGHQVSPFHNVNIHERKSHNANQAQERSFRSSAIHNEVNTKNNPQHFLFEETKPKQYQQRPFVKMRQYRSDQLQIIVPMKSHRTEFTYIDNIEYSCLTNRSHIEGDQHQSGKKKKMSVVSKSLISSPKIC